VEIQRARRPRPRPRRLSPPPRRRPTRPRLSRPLQQRPPKPPPQHSWSVRRIEVDRTPDGTNPNLAASDFSNDPTQSGAVKLGIFGPGNRRSATISPGSDSITVDIVPIPSEKALRLLAYIAENYIATGSNPSIASTVSSHRGTVPVELESRRGGSNSDIHAIIGRVDARSTSHHTCVKSK